MKKLFIVFLFLLLIGALCSDPVSTEGTRTGAICNDGTRTDATGSGACSSHGGVKNWLYKN